MPVPSYPQAIRDRQIGLMSSRVQTRDDGDALWTAFRLFVGRGWSNRDEDAFVAGWDAAKREAASQREGGEG